MNESMIVTGQGQGRAILWAMALNGDVQVDIPLLTVAVYDALVAGRIIKYQLLNANGWMQDC